MQPVKSLPEMRIFDHGGEFIFFSAKMYVLVFGMSFKEHGKAMLGECTRLELFLCAVHKLGTTELGIEVLITEEPGTTN